MNIASNVVFGKILRSISKTFLLIICSTSFLQPADPHFASISVAFLEEYKKLYGLTHFYNIDLFNEVNPASK